MEQPARVAGPRRRADPAEGAGVRYQGRGAAALDGVTLTIAPGGAWAGGSGGRARPLLALLARLADPTDGRVAVGGVDLRAGDAEAWRRRVAWVPERPSLVSGTVAENVRMGDPGADEPRIDDASRSANAAMPSSACPRHPHPGRRGRRPLSAGEAQRVALARAFLRDPSRVLLDEPVANLDPEGAALVEEAIERLCRGRTAVLAVHRLGLAGAPTVSWSCARGR